jgi:PGF-CTERM protein
MPGFGALIALLGLGALAWFMIRPNEKRETSKPQDSEPKEKG